MDIGLGGKTLMKSKEMVIIEVREGEGGDCGDTHQALRVGL